MDLELMRSERSLNALAWTYFILIQMSLFKYYHANLPLNTPVTRQFSIHMSSDLFPPTSPSFSFLLNFCRVLWCWSGVGWWRNNGGQVKQKMTYSKKLGGLLWRWVQKVGKGGVTPQKVALLPSPSRPTQNTIIQIIKHTPPQKLSRLQLTQHRLQRLKVKFERCFTLLVS